MAIERIIPQGIMSLAEYVDDIVRMGTRSQYSPVKSPIQWSAREWAPTAQEVADYGPSAGRVLNFFDYLENVPKEAILVGERSPMRMVYNPRKASMERRNDAGIYVPWSVLKAGREVNIAKTRPDLRGSTVAETTIGTLFSKIPEGERALRSQQRHNAQNVVREILKSRLGLDEVAANRSRLAVTAELLSDVPNKFAYQILTTPAETGLLSAQVANRVGPDFLDAMLTLSADTRGRETLSPARVLLLSEAGNFGPEIVTQAINNITARGDKVRGITVQDEIFRLLNREDLRPQLDDDISTVARNVRNKERQNAAEILASAKDVDLIPGAKTPEARRMNRLLNQLLTPDEKEGLSYLTPEQFGEFIQKVLRERAPGYGA